MGRFRVLVILAAVWLTLIFNIQDTVFRFLGIGNTNLDPVTYIVTSAVALVVLLLPDIARRSEITFLPALAIHIALRVSFSRELPTDNLLILAIEIIAIYVTVALFRRISLALVSFEHTVDSILMRPDERRVLPMDPGIERIEDEIARARRFTRQLGLLVLTAKQDDLERLSYRFDLEGELVKHHRQLRMAQIAELVLYNVDIVVMYRDEVLICMPETHPDIVARKIEELREEIEWRMNFTPAIGFSLFPEEGFIFRDLIDRATVRMYDEQDRLAFERETKEAETDEASDDEKGTATDNAAPIAEMNTEASAGERKRLPTWTNEMFSPWPDVIEQERQSERSGRGSGHRQDDLYDPESWVGVLPYQTEASRGLYLAVKRVLDLAIIFVCLPALIPIMSFIALLIWLEDRGPIFFTQERTGYGGERFTMYKFRTMVTDAEERLKDMASHRRVTLDTTGKLTRPLKLGKEDPRITRIGHLLRRTSLDELPQLFNVVRGDMSLVGPRPTSWDTSTYRLFHTERLLVKPGITGLWQVGARGNTNFDEWLDWDRTYVEKVCLSLDAQIFVRTIWKVLVRAGAY